MHTIVTPSSVSGTVAANPSKSHAQRTIAIAALAQGVSALRGVGSSDDVQSALRVAEAMGSIVAMTQDGVNITGGLPLLLNTWHCGESGLSLRMFSALAALYDTVVTLISHGTLSTRPVDFMAEPFHQLGVAFSSNKGFTPIRIKGPFSQHSVIMDGSLSSQFLTGLLIAMPLGKKDSAIEVRNLKSKPYIDLTLSAIQDFGVRLSHENYEVFHIPGGQQYRPAELTIQGDWSGMAFTLVCAALNGDVRITGLPPAESQADGKILEVLALCGADVDIRSDDVVVRQKELRAFEFDGTHCPDLFPPLVALAAHCDGMSRISGVHRLKSKESDRGVVLVHEFNNLGVRVWRDGDSLCVEGGVVTGAEAESHGDHRIAMALASTALKATGPVTISRSECVAKSYPDFFKDLQTLGALVQYPDAHA